MATAVTDTYLQQIQTARTLVNDSFRRAHELLAAREATLLRQLDKFQNKYETGSKGYIKELQGLEKSKQSLQENLWDNDTLTAALATINLKIEQILKLSTEAHTIRFEWNPYLDKNLQVGEFITSVASQGSSTPITLDYKNKATPVIRCGTHNKTNAPGDFNQPQGLAIEHETGKIYIADTNNDRVQVFTPNGEYSFMFSNKMSRPYGICINNNTVYITQYYGHCINIYKLDGTFISKVGSRGSSDGQFSNLTGLAVRTKTGHLYVCDYYNNRLQVFTKSLKFHHKFGSNIVSGPRDINLTSDLAIVLDFNNPCVHLFNITDHSLLNSIISRGTGGQIENSWFFAVDRALNLILTDSNKHCVIVFNKSGEIIAQFGKAGHSVGEFTEPMGVAIDNENRIVVVSENTNNVLQMF